MTHLVILASIRTVIPPEDDSITVTASSDPNDLNDASPRTASSVGRRNTVLI